MKKIRDHYFQKAKKEAFAARSAYKLKEIQAKHRIIQNGNAVLDLGCRPGSWMQVASQLVGKKGVVVGLDLEPVMVELPANCTSYVMDAFEPDLEKLASHARRFHVVISDMAPNTTGIKFVDQTRSVNLCEAALETARKLLKQNGNFVTKIFMGPGFDEFNKLMKKDFAKTSTYKPQSSRKESKEIFLVGKGFRYKQE